MYELYDYAETIAIETHTTNKLRNCANPYQKEYEDFLEVARVSPCPFHADLDRARKASEFFPDEYYLKPEHEKELLNSGIPISVAAVNGVCSLQGWELEKFGFDPDECRWLNKKKWYLVYPHFTLEGLIAPVRWQPSINPGRVKTRTDEEGDTKAFRNDRVPHLVVKTGLSGMKYASPRLALPQLYLPRLPEMPGAKSYLRTVERSAGVLKGVITDDARSKLRKEIFILTEGQKKALAGCAAGFSTVAMQGKDLSGDIEHDPIWRDLYALAKMHRKMVLCLDNDWYRDEWKRKDFGRSGNAIAFGLCLLEYGDERLARREREKSSPNPPHKWNWGELRDLIKQFEGLSSLVPITPKISHKLSFVLLPATDHKMGLDDLLTHPLGKECLESLLTLPHEMIWCKWGDTDAERGTATPQWCGQYDSNPLPRTRLTKAAKEDTAKRDKERIKKVWDMRSQLVYWSLAISNYELMGKLTLRRGVNGVWERMETVYPALVLKACDLLGWQSEPTDGKHLQCFPRIPYEQWLGEGAGYAAFSDCILRLSDRKRLPIDHSNPIPGIMVGAKYPLNSPFGGGSKVEETVIGRFLHDSFFALEDPEVGEGHPYATEEDRAKAKLNLNLFYALCAHIAEGIWCDGLNLRYVTLFWGESGSGKTTLADLMQTVFPSTPLQLNMLDNLGNAAGGCFQPKQVNIPILSCNDFKGVIGHNAASLLNEVCDNKEVPVKELYQNTFHTPLSTNIVMSANRFDLKLSSGGLKGLERRMVIIEMDRPLPETTVTQLKNIKSNPDNLSEFYNAIERDWLLTDDKGNWIDPADIKARQRRNERYRVFIERWRKSEGKAIFNELVEDDVVKQWFQKLRGIGGQWSKEKLTSNNSESIRGRYPFLYEEAQRGGNRFIIDSTDALSNVTSFAREIGSKRTITKMELKRIALEEGLSVSHVGGTLFLKIKESDCED